MTSLTLNRLQRRDGPELEPRNRKNRIEPHIIANLESPMLSDGRTLKRILNLAQNLLMCSEAQIKNVYYSLKVKVKLIFGPFNLLAKVMQIAHGSILHSFAS